LRKKTKEKKERLKVSSQKGSNVVQCWLPQGQEPDEKCSPIQWTEQPTAALVSGGLVWPTSGTILDGEELASSKLYFILTCTYVMQGLKPNA